MPRDWSTKREPPDPALQTHHWRVTIRSHWQRLRQPCARCHNPIDYDGPRYLEQPGQRRRLNPRYLVIGHKVSRRQARLLGWTSEQTHALGNTQPECQDCSNRSGATESNATRTPAVILPIARPVTSRRW